MCASSESISHHLTFFICDNISLTFFCAKSAQNLLHKWSYNFELSAPSATQSLLWRKPSTSTSMSTIRKITVQNFYNFSSRLILQDIFDVAIVEHCTITNNFLTLSHCLIFLSHAFQSFLYNLLTKFWIERGWKFL